MNRSSVISRDRYIMRKREKAIRDLALVPLVVMIVTLLVYAVIGGLK